ncbi:NAD(P)-dependent dehydrogenase (short-subunit alcohol dehydrogenase family) [Rhizobium sp. SG_E_25_P2]|uniref:SDR family NAD(P)-dependent oxidoreductase n=1 Tax=Rhizobium sp. SG_E_25_P2 TaxID=2879942 RepID=UPI0024765542|nr:SDR family oxidoreductase [Rhizobium sp. SG_E_25_P2]MDH6266013.1 NAD(P)-dependent dehydrogenase (short-subunit alcohol dehydrogenase family) [Rhizobium sp. SG_E_25_P2]
MNAQKPSHESRVAVVTGAARGIGQAIALKLASQGATLVLVDMEEAHETAQMIDGESLIVIGDVSSAPDWQRIDETVQNRFGGADIVVNNAGIGSERMIDDLDIDLWRKTLAINLEAHFLSAKQFVPQMRKKGWGRFVNISSNSIGLAIPGMSHYMASKMGVIGFVRGLANDVADSGITVNAVLPAITNTRLTQDMPEEIKRQTWQSQAIKRFAQPSDIAGAVAFLTSEDASFITGQALPVDGGQYKIS